MLPNSPDVTAVALGPDGIIEGAHPGLIFVDMSSIAPFVARQISEGLAGQGIPMLDAPVSGGEPKAIDGTLSVMVGGDRAVFDQVKDVLADMAASVVFVGEIGAGNIAKLANQVVVALNIAAVSEALVLAQKAGRSPQAVVEAIQRRTRRQHRTRGQGTDDARPQLQARIPDQPSHQGPVERLGHLPRRRRTTAPDRRGAGDDDRAQAAGHDREDHSGLVQHYESLAQTSLLADQA